MRLNLEEIQNYINHPNLYDVLSILPSRRIRDIASILVIKHKADFYLVKCRPGYENCLNTEDFILITKGHDEKYNLESLCGKFIVYDATGYRMRV